MEERLIRRRSRKKKHQEDELGMSALTPPPLANTLSLDLSMFLFSNPKNNQIQSQNQPHKFVDYTMWERENEIESGENSSFQIWKWEDRERERERRWDLPSLVGAGAGARDWAPARDKMTAKTKLNNANPATEFLDAISLFLLVFWSEENEDSREK